MTPERIIKKLNAQGVRFNVAENENLIHSELFQILANSVKAYRYAFDVDMNDEREAAPRFVLETKKKVRDVNGEKLRRARIYFPIEEVKDFFNKFNLDGEGFVEDKLVFYTADLENDVSIYYIISEDLLNEIMEMEDQESDSDQLDDEDSDESDNNEDSNDEEIYDEDLYIHRADRHDWCFFC